MQVNDRMIDLAAMELAGIDGGVLPAPATVRLPVTQGGTRTIELDRVERADARG